MMYECLRADCWLQSNCDAKFSVELTMTWCPICDAGFGNSLVAFGLKFAIRPSLNSMPAQNECQIPT